MTKPNDGGPAFPRAGTIWTDLEGRQTGDAPVSGMSRRDWFAGQALAGMAANPAWDGYSWGSMADAAYQAADAMLAASEADNG